MVLKKFCILFVILVLVFLNIFLISIIGVTSVCFCMEVTMPKRSKKCVGMLQLDVNEYGAPTFFPIRYSESCMSDGSFEADILLQKLFSDGEISLDDFLKFCLEVEK